jgi:hypothetical protein
VRDPKHFFEISSVRLATDYTAVGGDILASDPARRFANQESDDFGDFFWLAEAMQRRGID